MASYVSGYSILIIWRQLVIGNYAVLLILLFPVLSKMQYSLCNFGKNIVSWKNNCMLKTIKMTTATLYDGHSWPETFHEWYLVVHSTVWYQIGRWFTGHRENQTLAVRNFMTGQKVSKVWVNYWGTHQIGRNVDRCPGHGRLSHSVGVRNSPA